MCELLGMSANVPTDICFSFSGLIQRGGATGPHVDGWGISFYEGKACRTFKDSLPSCESRIARLVESYPIKSRAVIGHIRQANRGAVKLENTHPFIRELWGRHWTFAHNGQLNGYRRLRTADFTPIGNTDSERAFCWILAQLRVRYRTRPQNMQPSFRFIGRLCHRLRELGVFNMLLTDGNHLMAYCCSTLHWITRRAPFGQATLKDRDWQIDFAKETTPNDVVTVIATQPLTVDEEWHAMKPSEFHVFRGGEVII